MDASPTKRRVLAPLDANTKSPAAGPRLPASKLEIPRASTPSDSGSLKRTLDQENVPQSPTPAKKPRVSSAGGNIQSTTLEADKNALQKDPGHVKRERSVSPAEAADSSSIFDNSAIDTSQDTTITEPDAEVSAPPLPVPAPPPRRPAMTREEARQKAEVLRLRLGLASYKVRTGQTDVPLERLKLKPLPDQASPQQRQRQRQRSQSPQLPRLPSPSPRRSIPGDGCNRHTPQERSKEPGTTQRKALPAGPLQRSSSGLSQAHARVLLSPRGEESPRSLLLPPLALSLRDDGDHDHDGSNRGGGPQSGAVKGLLNLSRS
ncbi:hypothetical protein F5X99DRAFT_372946 [Biscogniauxia marginata]|nr:hypothetical protein F5X99DRAFT_372946 [Biscogniauxia marginata]